MFNVFKYLIAAVSIAILLQPTGLLCTKQGGNDLFAAIKTGDLDKVKKLVEQQSVDVNSVNSSKITPLGVAYLAKQTEIQDYLIKRGADINGLSNELTVLHMAISKGDFDNVVYFIKHGANVNIQSGRPVPLKFAASKCALGAQYIKIVKVLVEYGATDIPVSNGCGELDAYFAFVDGVKNMAPQAFYTKYFTSGSPALVKERVRDLCNLLHSTTQDRVEKFYRLLEKDGLLPEIDRLQDGVKWLYFKLAKEARGFDERRKWLIACFGCFDAKKGVFESEVTKFIKTLLFTQEQVDTVIKTKNELLQKNATGEVGAQNSSALPKNRYYDVKINFQK